MFRDRVRQLTGMPSLVLASNVPVELRRYLPESDGMEWHVDDVLFEDNLTGQPVRQTELVVTILNHSLTKTMWKDKHDEASITSTWTEENSVICIRAAGVEHAVRRESRVNTQGVGRVILKLVFVDDGVTKLSQVGKEVLGQVPPMRARRRRK